MHAILMDLYVRQLPTDRVAADSSARRGAGSAVRASMVGFAGLMATAILFVAMLPGFARAGDGAGTPLPAPLAAPVPAVVVGR